jgi:hypothetical protein
MQYSCEHMNNLEHKKITALGQALLFVRFMPNAHEKEKKMRVEYRPHLGSYTSSGLTICTALAQERSFISQRSRSNGL